MEISPIPGIRSLAVTKTPPVDADLSRVFDIENSSKPDDDTYSGSSKKGAGGQDGEDESIEETEALTEAQPSDSAEDTGQSLGDQSLGVNYFA